MNKMGIALCTILGCSSFMASASDPHRVKIANCEGLDADGIAAVIKGDYQQNRIVSWPDDQKKLGQADPVAWVDAKEITGKDDKWKVPLTVRGMNTDIHYTVMVDCKAGLADYRS